MSDRHERRLAAVLGGRQSRGSGSVFSDGDGRRTHGQPFAFAWDGKSTLGGSISITRAMWRKMVEQATWGRPMLAFGFFSDTRLSDFEISLVAVSDHDFSELLEAVDTAGRMRERLLALAQLAELGQPVPAQALRAVARDQAVDLACQD
jgi:hypothetical protein